MYGLSSDLHGYIRIKLYSMASQPLTDWLRYDSMINRCRKMAAVTLKQRNFDVVNPTINDPTDGCPSVFEVHGFSFTQRRSWCGWRFPKSWGISPIHAKRGFSIETHGDLGIPHLKKATHIYILISICSIYIYISIYGTFGTIVIMLSNCWFV